MKMVFLLLVLFSVNCFSSELSLLSDCEMPAFSEKYYLSNEMITYANEDIDDDGIYRILQDIDNPLEIKCIILKKAYLTDEGLVAIAKCCPNLEALWFRGNYITDFGIEKLASACSNLKGLSLNSTRRGTITDKSLEYLANNCPNLDVLLLYNHYDITEPGMNSYQDKVNFSCLLYSSNPKLNISESKESISFNGIESTDEEFLEILKTQTDPKLIKKIKISIFEQSLSEKTILNVAEHCPNLTKLHVGANILTDEGLVAISQNCPNLKSLTADFWDSKVSNLGLLALADGCPNIEFLELILCNTQIAEADIVRTVKKLPFLRTLTLRGYISENDSVEIYDEFYDDEFDREYFKELEEKFGRMISIPSFVSDEVLFEIASSCPLLEWVDFLFNPNITKTGVLQLLKSCENLKGIYIYGSALSKDDIENIVEKYPKIDIDYGVFPNKLEMVYNL